MSRVVTVIVAVTRTAVGLAVAGQSLQVDAVTGTTYSSKVVLKAIESALRQGL